MANGLGAWITLRWISSHSGVGGNEHADKLAKEAAEGKASRRDDLPVLIRNGVPTSASALKQENMDCLKRRWKANWLESPRWRSFEHIDLEFPFEKYRAQLNSIMQGQASKLMQIRSGHILLNAYLFKIGKANLPHCRTCKANLVKRDPKRQ
jgi:hypothetical protein